MTGKTVLAALIAGILAGLILGGIQYVRVTPLILAAEVYETAVHDHGGVEQDQAQACVENMPGMKMCDDAGQQPGQQQWQPRDGFQRTFFTTVASMMAGAGFAAMLLGVSLLTSTPITPANGLIWGLCGFLAVQVAPGAGLPPELPGMPVADLYARQIWWIGTIAATGAGLYLIAKQRRAPWLGLAIVLIALPHLIGAPLASDHHSAVPASLAAAFASNTVAAAAVFWCLIGTFLGLASRTTTETTLS